MPVQESAKAQWVDCERYCRRFESAWHNGASPAMESFLPPADDALFESVLLEFVHLDLEFRLKAGNPVRVEDYLARFPQLKAHPQTVLDLIEEEFSLRRETDVNLSALEYLDRFPPLAAELQRRLSNPCAERTSIPRRHKSPPQALTDETVWPRLPGVEILSVLGHGGMGIVYQARQAALDRVVAVKMIRSGIGADADERQRFLSETRAAASLHHPNIVQIYEVGDFQGQPYCVLELVAGGTLQRRLAGGPLPFVESAQMLETITRAIHYAHEQGIVHRDLKPANILLKDASAVPKIADFGLAKRMQSEGSSTETGNIVGTLQYMAPEQAIGHGVGPRADIYSLGAMLYEMLTGRPPIQGANSLDTLALIRTQEPVPPTRLQPALPRDLETICLKCLQKEPSQRYADAAALADDLRRFLAGEPILARPVGRVERLLRWSRREPALASTIGLAISLGVAALVISILFAVTKSQDAAKLVDEQKETKKALDEKVAELTARQIAEAGRSAEEKQRRRFNRMSTILATERGQKLCEDNDIRQGLMWLVRALEIVPDDAPDLELVLRHNLAAWRPLLGDISTVIEHDPKLDAAHLSPTGKHAFTVAVDQSLRLWNLQTSKSIPIPGLRPNSEAAVFSPDGTTFTVMNNDGHPELREAVTGTILGTLPIKGGQSIIHPNGQIVATPTRTGVQLWDGHTSKRIGAELRHNDPISDVAFTADGAAVLTVLNAARGIKEIEVRRWNPHTGAQLDAALKLPLDSQAHQRALSADGKYLLTLSNFGKLRSWDLSNGKMLAESMPKTTSGRISFGFHPDGKHYWLARGDALDCIETATGKPVINPWINVPIRTVTMGKHESIGIVSTQLSRSDPPHWTQNDVLVDLRRGEPLLPPYPHADVLARSIGSDGRIRLVVRTSPESALVIDHGAVSASGYPRLQRAHDAFIVGPEGAVGIRRTTPLEGQLWDLKTNVARGEPFLCGHVSFDRAEQRLLARGHDGSIRLLDVAAGKLIAAYPKQEFSSGLLSPDGQRVIIRNGTSTINVFGPDGQTLIESPIILPTMVMNLTFGPDAKTFLVTERNRVNMFDTKTAKEAFPPLNFPKDQLTVAALSPNRDILVTISGALPSTLQRWDARTGATLGKPTQIAGTINDIRFNAAGTRFLTASLDQDARLWDTVSGEPLGPSIPSSPGMALDDEGTIAVGADLRPWHLPTGRRLGPALRLPNGDTFLKMEGRELFVLHNAFRADEIRKVRLPDPVTAKTADVVAWAEAATGLTMDLDGNLRATVRRVGQP